VSAGSPLGGGCRAKGVLGAGYEDVGVAQSTMGG